MFAKFSLIFIQSGPTVDQFNEYDANGDAAGDGTLYIEEVREKSNC